MVGLRSILCPALYSSCRSQGRGGCGTAQSSHHCGACFPEATRPVPAPWGTGSSRSAPSRGWGQRWRAIRCLDLCTPHWSLVLLPPPPRPLSVQVPGPLSPVPGGGYLGPMAPRRPRAQASPSPHQQFFPEALLVFLAVLFHSGFVVSVRRGTVCGGFCFTDGHVC